MAWQRKFWFDQLKMLGAAGVGSCILWLPCMLKAWSPAGKSIKDGRPIDGWTWKWLWPWFHNPEDGDSGVTALVNGAAYNPTGSRWGAYCWSAWRNTANALKYKYVAPGSGPLTTKKIFGVTILYGYRISWGFNVPLLEKYDAGNSG